MSSTAPKRAIEMPVGSGGDDSSVSSDCGDNIVQDNLPRLVDLESSTGATFNPNKTYPHEDDDHSDIFAQYRLGGKTVAGMEEIMTASQVENQELLNPMGDDGKDGRNATAASSPAPHQYSPDSPSMRQFVREQRLDMESSERRRPLIWCGLLVATAGIIMTCIGAVEIGNAEKERRHGWTLTTCQIEHNYGANDTKCIYFSVKPNMAGLDNRLWCGVPAALASEAWFHEPPACSHLNRADTDDIEYWHSLGDAQVECYVPTGDSGGSGHPVSSEECTTSSASQGPSAIVWRSWIDRFVYLVRRPREAAQAIESVTRPRLSTGVALLVIGLIVCTMGTCCACNRCVLSVTHAIATQPPRINRYYQRRHAERHKLY